MKSLTYLFFSVCFLLNLSGQNAGNITFNSIPKDSEGNFIHRQATARYSSVTVNGVEIPVIDGLNPEKDKDRLDYDYTTFSAGEGKATMRIRCVSPISNIQISPIKLGIPVTMVDNYTCEFDIPEPSATEPFYLIVTINGVRLAIARDQEETNVPVKNTAGVFDVTEELGVEAALMTNAVAVASAFQRTVDKASAYGTENTTQGIVLVPAGLYYMGNLRLKSNTAMYLAPGAVIRFSDNKEDYTDDFIKASLDSDDPAGRHGTWWISTEEGADNVKIYGRGTLDGNGYYLQKRVAKNRKFCNHILIIMQASNVHVEGITFFQAALWGTIIARSNDVTLKNVKIFHSMDGNENDGIDVCESQNVLIDRAIGIALDDPFSTKTWSEETDISLKWKGSPEILDNVTFNHCISLTYCGAFKCGHGAMQHQSNIVVKNSVVVGAGRAIGVEPKYGHPSGQPVGGFSDITFENMDIEGAGGEGWLKILAERPDVGNPPARNITLRNINIRTKSSSGTLLGFDEQNKIEGVTFDNIFLYGNNEPVTSLAELNILNTGFYKDVVFIQDKSRDALYKIEAEYANATSVASFTDNSGTNSDTEMPGGKLMTGLKDGSWLKFKDVDLGSNTEKISLRMNITRASTDVKLVLDDPETGVEIGSASFGSDGSGVWSDKEIVLSGATGKHDLFLVFKHATASGLTLGNINYFQLVNRTFINLESLAPAESPLKVNIDQTLPLVLEYTPANAYQREVEWTILSESETGVIELSKEGMIRGIKEGTAQVKAISLFDASISTVIEVIVVDNFIKETRRVWAKDADILCDTYHYDKGINVSEINDPETPKGLGINSCWNTNFVVFKNVDFGLNTIKAAIRKGYPRGSKMELWIDKTIDLTQKTATGGTMIGSVEFPAATTDWNRWKTFDINITGASGVHDLCLVFLAGGGSATNQNYGALNWIDFTTITGTTGIEEPVQSKIPFVSNPVKEQLTIRGEDLGSCRVLVSDLTGTAVFHSEFQGGTDIIIPAQSWAKGLYVLEINEGSMKYVHKIIKE